MVAIRTTGVRKSARFSSVRDLLRVLVPVNKLIAAVPGLGEEIARNVLYEGEPALGVTSI